MSNLLLLTLSLVLVSMSEGSRILIANPYGTKSHQNTYVPLTKELVRRGHHVTIITNIVNDELAKLENVRQIWLEKLAFQDAMFANPLANPKDLMKRIQSIYQSMKVFSEFGSLVSRNTYGDPQIQELMATESFDLVMAVEVCGFNCYPFHWHFKAPSIYLSPNVLFSGRAGSLGDGDNLSYIPFVFSPFTDRMNFFQRIINFVVSQSFEYFVSMQFEKVETIFKTLINPDIPTINQMSRNISLVFTNTHPIFAYPRPLPPQVIEVGGLHCRPANPLPEEMENFVTESEAGFIFFGLGSILKMDELPEELIQSFMNVFARLPQRVIWQWKGKVRPDLPQNVLAIPWLPQQDLLGHRNCRAFLTHGGLNSLQEAVYHGVPVLGFPSGSDQSGNVGKAVREGYALKLEWAEVNEEMLSHSIESLLHNSSFKNAAQRLSNLFRDQTNSPLERAIYWTEYLLRHKGVDHLKLGSLDLAPYQRTLVDVCIVLALSTLIPLILFYFCARKCCRRRNVSPERKRQ